MFCTVCNNFDLFPLEYLQITNGTMAHKYHFVEECSGCNRLLCDGEYQLLDRDSGDLIDPSDKVGDQEYLPVCALCVQYSMVKTCETCNNAFVFGSSNETLEVEQNFYCSDCAPSITVYTCADCDQTCLDTNETENGDVCNNCFSDYHCCSDCGCYSRNVTRRYGYGTWYCESCYEAREYDDPDYERSSSKEFKNGKSCEQFPFLRHVSLELEAENGTQSDLVSNLDRDWGIKHDGSLDDGKEINSPIVSGDLVPVMIDHGCRAMERAGYEATGNCGTHLHVNVNDLSFEELGRVVRAYLVFEECFTRLVDMSARNDWADFLGRDAHNFKAVNTVSNDWEKPTRRAVNDFRKQSEYYLKLYGIANPIRGRYHALNIEAYGKYGSFEWRLLEGTLDRYTIKAFTYLATAFIEKSRFWYSLPDRAFKSDKAGRFSVQVSTLFQALDLPQWVREWCIKRYKENDRKVDPSVPIGPDQWLTEQSFTKRFNDHNAWIPTDHTSKCRSCRQCLRSNRW